jgi:hypothetical protein
MPALQSQTTVTLAGGAQPCGKQVHSYCLRSNGQADAALLVHRDSAAGPVIWHDLCVAAALAKPFSPAQPLCIVEPETGHLVAPLFVEVSGAGAECDVIWE